jgi:hypothetical protein
MLVGYERPLLGGLGVKRSTIPDRNYIFVIVYDYVGRRRGKEKRRGAVRKWRDELPVSDRAIIDDKLRTLRDIDDPGLMPGFIVGPLSIRGQKFPHIYKIQAGGKVRLRPLLCRGPKAPEKELTLLVGAKERDGRFEPQTAPETAVRRRDEVIADENYRQGYAFPV